MVNKFGERMSAAWVRSSKWKAKGIGYGYLNDETPELVVGTLEVYRRRGAAELAMAMLIDNCKTQFPGISLSVGEKNIAAINLYEKFGFMKLPTENYHSSRPAGFKMYLSLK